MHEINRMVWVGRMPWHGLGKELPRNARYEEIVEAAGFYDARERDLFLADWVAPVPDRKALVRDDDGRYLATVARSYKLVQFSALARTLVEAAGGVGAIFTTAGTLGPTGIRAWLLGELPGEIVVKGDPSPIKKYLLGTTGHDGMSAIIIKNVCCRVVCANTLAVALGEREGFEQRIHHTANAHARLAQSAAAFKALVGSYERFGELANRMAATRFTDLQMLKTVEAVLPLPDDGKNHSRLLQDREKVLALFETAEGLSADIRGTAWAAFQSWSEFSDHHKLPRVRTGQDLRELRLESIWMGRAASLKQRSLAAIADQSGLMLAA